MPPLRKTTVPAAVETNPSPTLPPGYKLRKPDSEGPSRARRLDKALVARIDMVARFHGKTWAQYVEPLLLPHVEADEKRLAAALLGNAK